mgnify:CR=1 FL=1
MSIWKGYFKNQDSVLQQTHTTNTPTPMVHQYQNCNSSHSKTHFNVLRIECFMRPICKGHLPIQRIQDKKTEGKPMQLC